MSAEPGGGTPRRTASFTFGEAGAAALLISIVSGVGLAIPYDATRPLSSVAVMLLANPAAAFFRNLHYWSAQAFLILSIVHVWDHVRRPEMRRMRFGAWLRACLSVPAAALLAWSGFVLKGDTEAIQALRVVSTTVAGLPGIGAWLAAALFGRGESLQLLYVHHAATFTLFVWLVLVEHGRLVWPRSSAVAAVVVPASVLSLWLSPALHDGLSGVVQGPWYFVGLQEAFHWSPWPGLVVLAALVPLVALTAMRWMRPDVRRATTNALVVFAAGYGILTVTVLAFRGANWEWTDAWRRSPAWFVRSWVPRAPGPEGEPLRGRSVPEVMGRPEGCLVCHAGVTGLSTSHDPATVGCASCHLGNVFSLDAGIAHAGMLTVPGNLADARRTCGGACHGGIVARVERSLMTTLSGIVAGNRLAWDDPRAGDPRRHIAAIGFSPADSHLRHLCASCHLGATKPEPGPTTELSRGGGCTACHVAYSVAAQEALDRYRNERRRGADAAPPNAHPDVALVADNTPCFGCHSRSGRVSLSYEGWHEADPAPAPGPGVVTRTLEDDRVVVQVTPDAHAARGMICVDCHTAREVMGDGVAHTRQLDQAHVACEDCHTAGRVVTVEAARADEESRRLVGLRRLPVGSRPLLVTRAGDVLVNAFVDDDGRPRLLRKKDGGRLELRAPPSQCRDAVHQRVSCIGCHTAWAPRCPTCHTRFEASAEGFDLLDGRGVRGDWIETGGGFTSVPPTLGVRKTGERSARSEVIEPFIPGMIATLDRNTTRAGPPDPIFRRWYARAFSHTVTKAGRGCRSCHTDPVALGYGEGRLELVREAPQAGRWRFGPAHPAGPDGLPDDAWIGFLAARDGLVSARDDVRTLSVEEQRRVLAVGACLTCHTPDSPVMRESLLGFDRVLSRLSARCLRASW